MIPFYTENSMTLMHQVQHESYYAGYTPKLMAQPCYYARHIRHDMYFFQSGIMPYLSHSMVLGFLCYGACGAHSNQAHDFSNEGLGQSRVSPNLGFRI